MESRSKTWLLKVLIVIKYMNPNSIEAQMKDLRKQITDLSSQLSTVTKEIETLKKGQKTKGASEIQTATVIQSCILNDPKINLPPEPEELMTVGALYFFNDGTTEGLRLRINGFTLQFQADIV